jgi:ribosomal protein L40E
MHCESCGAQINDGASFCGKCGERLSNGNPLLICPQCGERIVDGVTFCEKCGNQVSEPRPSLVCENCGKTNPSDATRCEWCHFTDLKPKKPKKKDDDKWERDNPKLARGVHGMIKLVLSMIIGGGILIILAYLVLISKFH